MSDPTYPGAPIGDSVENIDDGELLDPAPRAGDVVVDHEDDVNAVIEGEAVDLDETGEAIDQVDDEPSDEVDAAAGEQSQAAQDRDEAGPNGTGVLVLETWQIQIPATGDATVDAALARLTDVEGLPPAQHADVYEAVHAGLHEALADLDRA